MCENGTHCVGCTRIGATICCQCNSWIGGTPTVTIPTQPDPTTVWDRLVNRTYRTGTATTYQVGQWNPFPLDEPTAAVIPPTGDDGSDENVDTPP